MHALVDTLARLSNTPLVPDLSPSLCRAVIHLSVDWTLFVTLVVDILSILHSYLTSLDRLSVAVWNTPISFVSYWFKIALEHWSLAKDLLAFLIYRKAENWMAFKFDGLASNWVYLILVEFNFDSVAAQRCDVIDSTMAMYTAIWSGYHSGKP